MCREGKRGRSPFREQPKVRRMHFGATMEVAYYLFQLMSDGMLL